MESKHKMEMANKAHEEIPGNPSTATSSKKMLNDRSNGEPLRVLSEEDWKFWIENAYVVIKNAVPREQAKATADFLWEFDEKFIDYLRNKRILAIDMELATLFSVAYLYGVPIGSIMLVSDMPLQRRGIKDKKKQYEVFSNYMELHLDLALDAVKNMDAKWSEVKRKLISEW